MIQPQALAAAKATPPAASTGTPATQAAAEPTFVSQVLASVGGPFIPGAPAEPPPALAEDPLPTPIPTVAAVAVVSPTAVPTQAAVISIPSNPVETIFSDFPGLFDLSPSVAVIGTNLLLSALVLLCLLLATTIFNSTLREHSDTIAAASVGVLAPVAALRTSFAGLPAGGRLAALKPLTFPLLLLATALIYSALDPGFGWNEPTAVLFVSLAVGLAATTFLYEGSQVVLSQKRFGVPAQLKLFPIALGIAAVSVFLTRVTDFHPGIIFGFVSAAAISQRGTLRDQGLIVWLPLGGLMVVSIAALALVSPLQEWSAGQSGPWASLPETVAVAIFVGGAQSVLLTLMPFSFNDGERIWVWSKVAWFALAMPATFLFFHAILNSEGDLAELSSGRHFGTILAVSVSVLILSVVVWAFFKLRKPGAPASA